MGRKLLNPIHPARAWGKPSAIAVLWYMLQLCKFGPSFCLGMKILQSQVKGMNCRLKVLGLLMLFMPDKTNNTAQWNGNLHSLPYTEFVYGSLGKIFFPLDDKQTFKLKVNFYFKKALAVKNGQINSNEHFHTGENDSLTVLSPLQKSPFLAGPQRVQRCL